jgi:hypothetical protein
MDHEQPGDHAPVPSGSWPELEPTPLQLVAFWPHADPPTAAEVLAALTAWMEATEPVGSEMDLGEGEVNWAIECAIDGVQNPVALWCEKALEVDDAWRAMLGDAASCPWVIRLQVQLDGDEGPNEYFQLLNLLAGSIADAAGVLDVTTGQFVPRAELDQEVLAADAVPIDRWMWRIVRLPGVSDSATA